MLPLQLAALAVCLLPSAFSAPHGKAREPNIFAFAGKFACPKSMRSFRAANSLYLPNTSPEEVWGKLGDSCEISWQGFELVSTSGDCNSHKALRTYRTADLELTERLDLILTPKLSVDAPLIPVFRRSGLQPRIYAQGYTMLNRPQLAGADVIRMKSLLKVVQVDRGTRVDWDVLGCSDYPEHLADKLEEVHQAALESVGRKVTQSSDNLRFDELMDSF